MTRNKTQLEYVGPEILFEEGKCLVVCKPPGLLTQAPPGIDSIELRIKQFIRARTGKTGRIYLGVPHRLDRPASGVMVFGLNRRAAGRLSEQFEARAVKKTYWACVAGRVEPAQGTWTDDVRKVPEVARAEVVSADHPEGRPAVLHYRVLGNYDWGSWLEIELETGRTHQIRVQAATRGHPVLGDSQYGSAVAFGPQHEDERLRAIALHARTLEFRHPKTRESISITAPAPDAWGEFVRQIKDAQYSQPIVCKKENTSIKETAFQKDIQKVTAPKRLIDPFHARDTFDTGSGTAGIYRLGRLEDAGLGVIAGLPYSIRVLLESLLRNCDGYEVGEDDVKNLAGWNAPAPARVEIPFKPARVVLQDFTGVPAVVDLAAMRSAMQRMGGDPKLINPLIPVDLTIDHSVQVDYFASDEALDKNIDLEFHRNRERYEFLRWGQKAFDNFRVVPPAVGIIHQVNLEYLAKGVFLREDAMGTVALPDSLVGTDSHTTMINGLGVVGWGVGGIEAEAVMLGQPLYMLMPEVVGFEMTGRLPPGATATDLVLRVVEMLRAEGVVGKFVEYFGPGVNGMTLADRATVANMGPEYGATMGFFPVDGNTLDYLRQTGRSDDEVQLVERYCKEQQLFRTDESPTPSFTKIVSLDLGTVEPSLAGPKRPQDRIAVSGMKAAFAKSLREPVAERGFELSEEEIKRTAAVEGQDGPIGHGSIGHGAVVIASITSCTNTSNPGVMLAAGLLAKKAVEKGLTVKPYVKTSLAPGSRVVTDYLKRAELDKPLDALGFQTVGYGCMTCIGNSGPLPEAVVRAVTGGDLVAASVLSGNRNFEGRVSPLAKANYLASPPLVVAYALAGTVDIDLTSEPLGNDADGKAVMLADIWPTNEEVARAVAEAVRPEMFEECYGNVFESSQKWNELPVGDSELFEWDAKSTYIQEPPFLVDLAAKPEPIRPVSGARVLMALGDSVTTDHISPAGVIAADSPAARYLMDGGVEPGDFNSYGSRRGNDRVMIRGTFANIRIRNRMAPGTEGGVTRHMPDGEQMPVYDAAMKYKGEGVELIVLAGSEYGTGSSRDWAAKGTQLLGVRAVIASSFERIHRSNLVGMGVLPLELPQGQTWESLDLTGRETFDIAGLGEDLAPGAELTVRAVSDDDDSVKEFAVHVRIDTPVELEYYRNGGILQTVLRRLAKTRNEST